MEDSWKISYDIKDMGMFKNCILIEGLPGMGNVGKIAVDFIVDEIKAKKVASLFSQTLPNSVFINEKNEVSLPKIELYHKKFKNRNYLFLVGDVQPMSEVSSYSFCEAVLNVLRKHKCSLIVTTAGIGLQDVPKKPRVYVIGNSKKRIGDFSLEIKVNKSVHRSIGPIMIMGVSGLLIALAKDEGIEGVGVLAETLNHPFYLGIKGAREIVKIFNKKFEFGIKTTKLNEEIELFEKESMRKSTEFLVSKGQMQKGGHKKETSYIG